MRLATNMATQSRGHGTHPVYEDWSVDPSRRQPPCLRRLAQLRFGETGASRIVEEDAVLLADPNGIGPHKARPLHLEKQAAGPTGPRDDPLIHRRLFWIELVVGAQNGPNV